MKTISNFNYYNKLIDELNNLPFIKNEDIEVSKLTFNGNRKAENRRVNVYFTKQKYSCSAGIWNKMGEFNQLLPVFFPGVDKTDKTFDIRVKMCHWLFMRFYIWLKRIDLRYDSLVNTDEEYFKWEPEIFAGLLDESYAKQYWQDHNLFNKGIQMEKNPEKLIKYYNEDSKNKLYPSDFGEIIYPKHDYKLLSKQEASQA